MLTSDEALKELIEKEKKKRRLNRREGRMRAKEN